MHIWLVQPHEHTPLDVGWPAIRTAHLARHLTQDGARVIWWTSRFHHHSRSHRPGDSGPIEVADGYSVILLDGPGYGSSTSLRRLLHYRHLARQWTRRAESMKSLPDLIHCVLPPLELAEAAILFAREHDIPISVDVMDIWPDVYLIVLPKLLRPAGRMALFREYSRLRRICSRAGAFTAISPDYLDWAVRHGRRKRRDADAVFALGAPSPQSERRPSAIDVSVQGRFEGRVVATFLGSFISMCDVQVVLRAAEQLSERGRDDVVFVIAGDGPNGDRIRRRAMNRPNIVLTGWLGPEESTWLLRRSNLGLATYVPDAPMSWPNKLWAYLAHGLPMICSLGGASRELIESEGIGIAYTAGDSASLASVVETLADDATQRRSMAARATELFRSRFRSDIIYPSMARHLLELAGSRRENAR